MPIYTIKDNNDGSIYELNSTIAEKEDILKNNPNLQQLITKAPLYGDPYRVMGVHRPDEGFRDHLREMKKKHYKNSIEVR
jgi:hypothetical protein